VRRRSCPEDAAAVEWARTIRRTPLLAADVAWVNAEGTTTYRLHEDGVVLAYLKVGVGPLARERDRLAWLRDRVAVPDVLGFTSTPGGDWLLTTPLRGAALSQPEHKVQPHRLVRLLVSAIKRVHALDPAGCPFGGPAGGDVVIHGDATLPNFVFDGTRFAGCLDVGDVRLGRPEVDLVAAVWSLDHNLGPGFGGEFLREYGWPQTDETTVERLRRSAWKPAPPATVQDEPGTLRRAPGEPADRPVDG
jgi:aminoglycoside phosphotransferase